MDEVIVVRQDEGTPLLHLQTVLDTWHCPPTMPLGGREILGTQPGLIGLLGLEGGMEEEREKL